MPPAAARPRRITYGKSTTATSDWWRYPAMPATAAVTSRNGG